MTTRNFTFISLAILPFIASGQQSGNDSGKLIMQDIHIEDIGPPPPDLISKFKTLQDWLVDICDNDNPNKSKITKYQFELFGSANGYTIALIGVNTYENENHSVTSIEFEPSNTYFKLPETYYENLNRQQLLKKLTFQLKDFANTEKFNASFFTKASIVVFETNGQTIWSKQQ